VNGRGARRQTRQDSTWHRAAVKLQPGRRAGALFAARHSGYILSMQAPDFQHEDFLDPQAALDRVVEIHAASVAYLRDAFHRYVAGEDFNQRIRAFYPVVRIQTTTVARADSRLAYGFVAGPGIYETTLTRPELYGRYYLEQFRLLLGSHDVPIRVGVGTQPIPVHFSFVESEHIEAELDLARLSRLPDIFDLPDLHSMDDGIANGTYEPAPGEPHPLSLFTGPRVDYSLHRLRHYTGTSPEHFQNYVLFTNYQFYVDEFLKLGRELMARQDRHDHATGAPDGAPSRAENYVAFIEPATPSGRLPQMPAWHLIRPDRTGITMVNIGVGPSNAKTITDHIAVLRPHAWIMLGHCAGLRNTQRLGDYVLAHGYVREDHVLDEELPLWVPIPALAEIQLALEKAVADVTQLDGFELKRIMRTGTVASTDNRNWELLPHQGPSRRFSQSRAVALDMESATIAANGFRFRVPYGTLLCVSDKPLHGDIKLPGMANRFYRERVDQHLRIGMRAIELLRSQGMNRLHSRKLRSFAEVAFQ
jgi:AMP nucleosidase